MFVTLSRNMADFRLRKIKCVSRILFLGECCLLLGFMLFYGTGHEGPKTSLKLLIIDIFIREKSI